MVLLSGRQTLQVQREGDKQFFVGEKVQGEATVNFKCRGCNNSFEASVSNRELAERVEKNCCFSSQNQHKKLISLPVGIMANLIV